MTPLRPTLDANDHVFGSIDAPITLLEYGDYECPHCGRAYEEVKQVLRTLGDRACLVYRHFPLTELHPHAMQAAEAAEAAGTQMHFWQMHSLLYENQDELTRAALIFYAKSLGLERDRFIEDLDGHADWKKIRRDFRSGVRSGVTVTPTLFINGTRHDGPYTADALLEAIGTGAAPYAP